MLSLKVVLYLYDYGSETVRSISETTNNQCQVQAEKQWFKLSWTRNVHINCFICTDYWDMDHLRINLLRIACPNVEHYWTFLPQQAPFNCNSVYFKAVKCRYLHIAHNQTRIKLSGILLDLLAWAQCILIHSFEF